MNAPDEDDDLKDAFYIRADIYHKALADRDATIARLQQSVDGFRRMNRETFEAMCAMRDGLNEMLPMPSLESDLLQGPENSVFCAEVVKAVKTHIDRLQARLGAGPSVEQLLKWMPWAYHYGVRSEIRETADRMEAANAE